MNEIIIGFWKCFHVYSVKFKWQHFIENVFIQEQNYFPKYDKILKSIKIGTNKWQKKVKKMHSRKCLNYGPKNNTENQFCFRSKVAVGFKTSYEVNKKE